VVLGVKEFERRLIEALEGGAAASADGVGDKDGEEEASRPPGEKRGNPFRLSKAERRKRKRLERL
jgi:hypothetical protein